MAKPKKPKKAPAADAFFRPFAKLAPKKKSQSPSRSQSQSPSPSPSPSQSPSPSPSQSPSQSPSIEPDDTFAIYMSGVRALDQAATRIPRTASKVERGVIPKPREDPDGPAREQLRTLVAEGVRFEMTDDGEQLEGRRLDTDPRDLRRLRRGAFAIDGRLDLHGHGVAEARAAVEAFVEKRAKLGDVAVIVVHGKGTHSPRGQGVLRGELGAWLTQGPAARHVRAFTTAPEEDGGSGALLVLLAR
jgi:DNA-nicking Smr family endonuclease